MRIRPVLLGLAAAAVLAGCSSDPGENAQSSAPTPAEASSSEATGTPTTSPIADRNSPPPTTGGCNGSFGQGAVESVLVGSEEHCVLTGTRVDGDITVQEGGSLEASAVSVSGTITAVGARSVTLDAMSVTGQISISDSGPVALRQSKVADVSLTDNTMAVEVRGNTLDGALRCQGNEQTPRGGLNVGGQKAGQCSSL